MSQLPSGPRPTQRWAAFLRRRGPALAVAAVVLLSAVAAVQWVRSREKTQYLEVYLTDAPAEFRNLNLCVARVMAGGGEHEVPLRVSQFDLMAHRGTANPLLVAAGEVPAGPHREITIDLCGARGNVGSSWIDVRLPHRRLHVTSPAALPAGDQGGAVLLDVDLNQSLILTSRGFEMRPFVGAMYVHDFDEDGGAERRSDPSGALADGGFKGDPTVPEQHSEPGPVTRAPFVSQSPSASSSTGASTTSSTTTTTDCDACDSAGPDDTGPPDPGPQGPLPSNCVTADDGSYCGVPLGTVHQWIVHVKGTALEAVSEAEGLATVDNVSLPLPSATVPASAPALPKVPEPILATVRYLQDKYLFFLNGVNLFDPSFVVTLAAQQAQALCQEPLVVSCEPAQRLLFPGDLPLETGLSIGPITAAALDGAGVGIALLDTGVDATHPDLARRAASAVSGGVVREAFGVDEQARVRTGSTDPHGHGTHAAGLLLGQANLPEAVAAAGPGMAPGASLYAWALGPAATTASAARALDHLLFLLELDRQDDRFLEPDIRVLHSGWSLPGAYDPSLAVNRLLRRMVEDHGLVVVVPAGNQGGDGTISNTSSQCQIPVEGILCVGGVDGAGRPTAFSSRGAIADASTWPDLVAPAVGIVAAKPATVVPVDPKDVGSPYYQRLSGTSAAAPFVTACVALLLEARPMMTASQVEATLEATAWKVGSGYAVDSDARFHASHFAKGHGRLDCEAALTRAMR